MAIDLKNDFPANDLLPWIAKIDMIRIEFPVFSDGRGFSLACQLRLLGFVGRLRAKGHFWQINTPWRGARALTKLKYIKPSPAANRSRCGKPAPIGKRIITNPACAKAPEETKQL